jgi:hypothetical protein
VVAGTRIWEQVLVEPKTPEAVMTGVIVIIGVALFLAGVGIGVFAAVAVAVRREDRSYHPLTGEAPSRRAKYVRYLNGLVRRDLDSKLFPSHGHPRRY